MKIENVKTDLKVAHRIFYDKPIRFSRVIDKVDVTNQFSHIKHEISIKQLLWGEEPLLNSKTFPDETYELFGGTTTIFQKIDSGYLRISTNVLKETVNEL